MLWPIARFVPNRGYKNQVSWLYPKYLLFTKIVVFSVCVCVCVSTITQNKWYKILKLEYIVGYENSSDKVNIWHCRIKVNSVRQMLYLSLGT